MTQRAGTIVVGAGVVGLAAARALAQSGRETIVLERADGIGREASSRNSEVIHAGLYYPTGSAKARLCRPGREALERFCDRHGVPRRPIGKIIVATCPGDHPRLERIAAQAARNGVDDLERLDARRLAELEPALAGSAGLLSPSTGIVDSHAFMEALRAEAESAGALIAFDTPVRRITPRPDGLHVETSDAGGTSLVCDELINAAGLGARTLALSTGGLAPDLVPEIRLVKGSYFACSSPPPFSRLIYPVPSADGLGIHLTLDLAGQARFGPDAEPVDTIDYEVHPGRAGGFYHAVRRFWPDLPDGSLRPAFAGIRAKAYARGSTFPDFIIQGPADHGIPGLVNLFGFESPGLTAALTVAEEVTRRLRRG